VSLDEAGSGMGAPATIRPIGPRAKKIPGMSAKRKRALARRTLTRVTFFMQPPESWPEAESRAVLALHPSNDPELSHGRTLTRTAQRN